MFINAFASTASSLVSNLLGAGYAEQIMPLCRKMIRLCFCFVLPLCILAAAIPYWTLRIYTDDVSLIEYAIPSLWVMLTTNIPCTAAFIYQFSVSGTGNTRTALTIVACTSIVYVAYTALLVYGLHADVALAGPPTMSITAAPSRLPIFICVTATGVPARSDIGQHRFIKIPLPPGKRHKKEYPLGDTP